MLFQLSRGWGHFGHKWDMFVLESREFERLCIKVGRGQGERDVGTRVWGLGTWGRETRDLGTSSMGRRDVKNRDTGDAGCE